MGIQATYKQDIIDDLDGKTRIGYRDQDGITTDLKGGPLEPYTRLSINGRAKVVWTTEENYKKHLDPVVSKLEEADDDEDNELKAAYVRIEELEQQLRDAGIAPVGKRAKYGASTRKDTKPIREWLRNVEGVEIGDRGRIPVDLMAKYEAAHPGATEARPASKPAAAPAPAFSSSSGETSAVATVAKTVTRPGADEILAHYNKKHGKKLKSLSDAQANESYEDLAAV